LNIKNVKDAEAEYNKYVKGDMLMIILKVLSGNFSTQTRSFTGMREIDTINSIFIAIQRQG